MNKIVTVNIGGIAITIEEDAFDALRDYIKHISNHFKDTENGDEIIADIEHRIGEMLSAKLSERKISIDVADVKEVAQVMGYPADFDDSKAEAVDESQGETTTENTTTTENEQGKQTETTKARRKLYRDPENKHLGGVIGGLAVYFDLDATILRILWLIAFFAFGLSFWVYIILWAVIPEAKTASERLEMRGESPTVESIKKNIHEEAKAAYDRVTSPETQKSVSRFTDKVVHLVTSILGVAFRFVGVFAILAIGFALVGLLISLFTTTSGLVIGRDFFSADALHFATTSSPGWILRIAGYLIVALPLVYVAILILPSLMDVNKPSKSVRQGLISTWIIAVLVAIGSILFSSQQFRSRGSVQRTEMINLASDTIIVKVDADRLTDYAIASRYVELDESFWSPHLWREQSASVKQGSGGALEQSAQIDAHFVYVEAINAAVATYQRLLQMGVCKEQARAVLPVATMSECYWTCSLHALIHFLRQRLDGHAQQEIREYAQAVSELAEGVEGLSFILETCLDRL